MKIMLATGVPDLDAAIEDRIKIAEVVGTALYKEAVADVVERKKPNIIILSELLEGVTPMRELILELRNRFPELRIIYILKDENPAEKAFLYHWMIFDVISGPFTVPELEEIIESPKEFKDIYHEMEDLKPYRNQTTAGAPPDISGMTSIKGEGFNPLTPPDAGTDTVYQQIVSFWSVSEQSGKTFSAVNTALTLASRKELKILLLDFNLDNPNVNLHFTFADPERNLGAIMEDAEEEGIEITKDNFDDYLITHPTYKNLKILPGAILRMKRKEDGFVEKIFNQILEAAEQSNFSTILIDLESGLSDLNTAILKKSSRIFLHVSENPGSANKVYRFFDTEMGPFVEKQIDRKKILSIITGSEEDTQMDFKRVIDQQVRVGAIIDHSPEIRKSIFKGAPILANRPPEHIYDSFIRISNLIHDKIFMEKPRRTLRPGTKAKGFSMFGFLKNKK